MSNQYDVIVIGAGIGGLSTGLHLLDKGYKTLILEAHTLPGGLCTSFERKGYTIDTSIHWLVGCIEGGGVWHTLNRFNLLPEVKLRRLEQLATIRTPEHEVTIGDDVGEYERFLCRLFPSDERELVRFFKRAKSLPRMIEHSPEDRKRHPFKSLGSLFSYWPLIMLAFQFGKLSYDSYLKRFKEKPRIRPYLSVFTDDSSVLINFYLFSWLHQQDLYTPQVNSLGFSRAFESRFKAMGGEIRYNARVSKILVNDGIVKGVNLENGEEIYAKTVVSNADGYQTLFQLLGKEFVPPSLVHLYETAPLFGSMLLVSLGVNQVLTEKDMPARMLSECVTAETTGVKLADLDKAPVTYKLESLYNPAVAPPGKSLLLFEAMADFNEWKTLRQNGARYREAKQMAGEIVLRRTETCFPQLKGKLEVIDVATPVTFERYTCNREGSIQGWRPTPAMIRHMNLPWRPTHLPNLFMVGQWISVGGGIPPSVMGGEKVAGLVAKYIK